MTPFHTYTAKRSAICRESIEAIECNTFFVGYDLTENIFFSCQNMYMS